SLIRWQHPDLGLVGPLDFIALAEETGMIVELGNWILEESCRAAAAWRAWLALVPDLTRRGLPGNAADLRFEGRIVLNAPPELLGRGKT
ncbi:MAG TPA: EAL domain-containing protein, partial [Thermoanaerobaculia bacterium]|nr:EAL domain-containing protein [Thermoanaerobaculia bacterium]